MNQQLFFPPRPRPRRWAWICLVALVVTPVGPLDAGAACRPAPAALVKTQAGNPALASRALLATSWWHKIYDPLASFLGYQRHMVQFAAVGAIVGLYIIWWRK